jgi:hypothetical protein
MILSSFFIGERRSDSAIRDGLLTESFIDRIIISADERSSADERNEHRDDGSHVTVGRNAELRHQAPSFHGSLWVKQGGRHYGAHPNRFRGDRHTFLREDNGTWEDPRSGFFGQYLSLHKNETACTWKAVLHRWWWPKGQRSKATAPTRKG